jgi:hypothetical protein
MDQPTDVMAVASPAERRFDKPVVIQLGRIDRDRVVSSAVDAGRILLNDWRHDDESRLLAMSACLAVIKGERPASFARHAFVEAARSARILLSE